jgi:hypothetical protein
VLNLRVQDVHSNDAFFVEEEGAVDEDAPFLAVWAVTDGWALCAIEGLTSPRSESEEAGESMVTVFIAGGAGVIVVVGRAAGERRKWSTRKGKRVR